MITEVIHDARTLSPIFPASTAIDAGDLIWYDSTNNLAKKASQQSDAGSQANNEAAFAPVFLGVAVDRRLAGETTAARRVVSQDCVVDADCPSTTWKIGDLVTVRRDGTNTLNFNQDLIKTTTAANAIGYVIQDSGGVAATKVRARLVSNVCPNR